MTAKVYTRTAGSSDDPSMVMRDLMALEMRVHALGLHVTGHALNRAKNAMGWEMSGDIVQAGQAALRTKP